MGEIPYELDVQLDENHKERFVLYGCETCGKFYLAQTDYQVTYCPLCGSKDKTYLEEELT